MTGQCMQMFPGQAVPNSLVAQAMPPLAADFSGPLEIYVTVKASGDFEFVRVCQNANANSIAHSGWITRDMLPFWTTEIFAAINIKTSEVLSETRVSAKPPVGGLL